MSKNSNDEVEPADTLRDDLTDDLLDELIESHRQRTPDCPTEEMLVQYLDKTLAAREQVRLQAHIPNCPHCACLVAGLKPLFRPVAQLHDANLLSLYRQLKTALHTGQSALIEAWQVHSMTCGRCRWRGRLLIMAGARIGTSEAPASVLKRGLSVPSFALGVACMVPVIIAVRFASVPTNTADIPIKIPSAEARGGTGNGAFPDLSAQGILGDLLSPAPKRVSSTIDIWKSLPPENSLTKQAALAGIYLKQARTKTNPARHHEAIQLRRAALLDLRAQTDQALKDIEKDLEKEVPPKR